MSGMDSNHCQVVRDALEGRKAVCGQTFASLAILSERLERLKRLDKIFCAVEFSPDVERLKTQKLAVGVG